MRRRAADVAAAVGGTLHGDPGLELTGMAPLESAGPGDLSFLARADYRDAALASRAGCVIAATRDELPGRPVIVATDPYRSFALAMALFHPDESPAAGVHPSAIVDSGARIDASAHVGPVAVVGSGAVVGARAVVHAGVVVGESCEVGEGTVLHPGVVLYARTVVGRRVIVHARAVLGSDGFGYSSGPDGHVKILHAGRVVVEDDVEIGAGTCIDRGAMGDTVVGKGTKIDNLVQVAHNVRIGEGCILVAQSGLSGSTTLGRGVVIAGQSGVAGHLKLGDGARVAAKSAVLQDVEAGATVGGIPAIPLSTWKRAASAMARLPDALRRLRRIEARLEGAAPGGAEDET